MSDSDQVVFFIDRALGKNQVANALKGIGEKIEVHDAHFNQDALDIDWLPSVAKAGWIILTADKGIGCRGLERLAVEQSKARVFVLVSGNLSGADMAEVFVKAINSIKCFVLKNSGPFIAKVHKNGTVNPWRQWE